MIHKKNIFLKKVPHNLSNTEENRLSLDEPGLTVYLSKPWTRFPLLKARLGLAGHSVVPLPVLGLTGHLVVPLPVLDLG